MAQYYTVSVEKRKFLEAKRFLNKTTVELHPSASQPSLRLRTPQQKHSCQTKDGSKERETS